MIYGDYISGKEIISEYVLKRVGEESLTPFNEDLATIFLNDAMEMFQFADMLEVYLHFDLVTNYKSKLPANFKYPLQVGFRSKDNSCCGSDPYKKLIHCKKEVVDEIEKELCDADVIIDCKSCSCEEECNCNASAPIKLSMKEYLAKTDQDLKSKGKFKHSYHYYENDYYKKPITILTRPHRDNPARKHPAQMGINNNFYLLRPTTSYYHNLPNEIKGCNLPDLQHYMEYNITEKVISVNKEEKGEILVSYLGSKMDDEGYLLIPNDARIIEALIAKISAAFALRDYSIRPSQTTRAFWMDMEAYSTKKFNQAKSTYKMPDPSKWDVLMRNIWQRKNPVRSYRAGGQYQ